jgi:signal transduction histidine kinase
MFAPLPDLRRADEAQIVRAAEEGSADCTYIGAMPDRRLRDQARRHADALLATMMTAGTAVEIAPELGSSDRPALTAVTLLTMTAAIGWRRRAPLTAAGVLLAALLCFERVAYVEDWMLPSIALLIAFYSVGAHVPRGRATKGTAALWLGGALVIALNPSTPSDPFGGVVMGLFLVMAMAVGRALATRRALTAELAVRAEQLEREREDRARQAALDERTRIARELHDVVAHSVSVMVIQTGAARRVAESDRSAARDSMRAVERAGRDALAEMRRMVGVLHKSDADLMAASAPGLSHLHGLADRARAAGLDVDLRIDGTPRPLPDGLEQAAYRVVQEALTNAIKHAAGSRTRVDVAYGPSALRLAVSDDGAGAPAAVSHDGSGQGLVGMRERVRLFGGDLATGVGEGGGFTVQAEIPLSGLAA